MDGIFLNNALHNFWEQNSDFDDNTPEMIWKSVQASERECERVWMLLNAYQLLIRNGPDTMAYGRGIAFYRVLQVAGRLFPIILREHLNNCGPNPSKKQQF